MRKLTVEEKLDLCIEFIKKIEQMDVPDADIEDICTIKGTCNECCSDDVEIDIPDVNVVDSKFIVELKDKAWHILADITD